jgi:hypothetical protein
MNKTTRSWLIQCLLSRRVRVPVSLLYMCCSKANDVLEAFIIHIMRNTFCCTTRYKKDPGGGKLKMWGRPAVTEVVFFLPYLYGYMEREREQKSEIYILKSLIIQYNLFERDECVSNSVLYINVHKVA